MTTLGTGEPTEELTPLPYTAPDTAADLFDDDVLDAALPGRPIRKKLGPFTILLAAFLIAALSFYGGVRIEKSHVKSSSGSATSALAAIAARFRTAAGGAGAGGTGASGAGGASGLAAAFGRSGTTGTIKLIDGTNVYIQETDGTIVKASTGPATTITIASPTTVTGLHPGDTVTITGATGSDGTIAATAVRDNS